MSIKKLYQVPVTRATRRHELQGIGLHAPEYIWIAGQICKFKQVNALHRIIEASNVSRLLVSSRIKYVRANHFPVVQG